MFAALPRRGNAAAAAAAPATAAHGVAAVSSQNIGSTYMGVPLSYPSWAPVASSYGSLLSNMFYISLAVFILFLILVVIHFTMLPIFSFSPNDAGLISIPTVSDQQIAYTKSPAVSDISANFIDVPACTYTLSTDIYLSGNFQSSTVPRVLLYRSLHTSVSPPSTTTIDDKLSDVFPDTNILLWLDPIKNDLFVGAVTSNTGTASMSHMEVIPAIENVPIKKVFRVTIVFTQKFLEVYVNGNLEKSLAFKNPPINVSTGSSFFPVISTIRSSVLISNVVFWPRALTAREVRANGLPISNESFFSKQAF